MISSEVSSPRLILPGAPSRPPGRTPVHFLFSFIQSVFSKETRGSDLMWMIPSGSSVTTRHLKYPSSCSAGFIIIHVFGRSKGVLLPPCVWSVNVLSLQSEVSFRPVLPPASSLSSPTLPVLLLFCPGRLQRLWNPPGRSTGQRGLAPPPSCCPRDPQSPQSGLWESGGWAGPSPSKSP